MWNHEKYFYPFSLKTASSAKAALSTGFGKTLFLVTSASLTRVVAGLVFQ